MTTTYEWMCIAGGRDINNPALVPAAIEASRATFRGVVVGKQRGVDTLAENWARLNGLPVLEFPADWNRYGVRAGHLRNADMAQRADALIAIWNGRSPGTKNMIEQMQKRGKPVFIYRVAA